MMLLKDIARCYGNDGKQICKQRDACKRHIAMKTDAKTTSHCEFTYVAAIFETPTKCSGFL